MGNKEQLVSRIWWVSFTDYKSQFALQDNTNVKRKKCRDCKVITVNAFSSMNPKVGHLTNQYFIHNLCAKLDGVWLRDPVHSLLLRTDCEPCILIAIYLNRLVMVLLVVVYDDPPHYSPLGPLSAIPCGETATQCYLTAAILLFADRMLCESTFLHY